MRLHLTAGTYEHFVNSRLVSIQGNKAVIGVVGRYACEWIQHRLVQLVEETMGRLLDGQPVSVTIVDLSQDRGVGNSFGTMGADGSEVEALMVGRDN